jgi:hypothetical protein
MALTSLVSREGAPFLTIGLYHAIARADTGIMAY